MSFPFRARAFVPQAFASLWGHQLILLYCFSHHALFSLDGHSTFACVAIFEVIFGEMINGLISPPPRFYIISLIATHSRQCAPMHYWRVQPKAVITRHFYHDEYFRKYISPALYVISYAVIIYTYLMRLSLLRKRQEYKKRRWREIAKDNVAFTL